MADLRNVEYARNVTRRTRAAQKQMACQWLLFRSIYDGANFARRGLVFVSANYRLGAFGFLELGPVVAELTGSAVKGLRDLVAALHWVQDTIAAFGGAPGSVTLHGQIGRNSTLTV